MNLKSLLFITLVLLELSAQSMAQDSLKCDCHSAFDVAIRKLEDDYIGLTLRKKELGATFDKRVAEFRQKLDESDPVACTAKLQEFLSMFHDGHLFVSQQPEFSAEEKEASKATLRKHMIDCEAVKQYLVKNQGSLRDIEGLWTEGTTRYAIVKNNLADWPFEYEAIVLASPDTSKVGELKLGVNMKNGKYVGVYYTNGYAPRYVELDPAKDNTLLGIWGGLLWGRVNFHDLASITSSTLYDPTRPTLKRLDNNSLLLTIPTFLVDKPVLDSLLLENQTALTSCEYLIVDIRGNSGGNGIYFDLMSLYANTPVKSEIGMALASADNLQYFSRFAQKSATDPYQPVVDEMKSSMGIIVRGPRFSDYALPKMEAKLKKVAILTDKTNISAAETFILNSKSASDKVVTIGTNTGGCVDYNNINMVPISCKRLGIYFGYPTFTMNDHILKDGFNGHGIPPDVRSDKHSTQLVDFALDYLKTHQ